jgi:hypothetical protein
MLKIDSEKMIIAMTRGDTANIVFSAVDEQGTTYVPVANDVLRFAVAKKVGADPLFELTNIMSDDATAFWTITIQPANTNPLKFGDYAFDVQLTHNGEVDTIIGATDEINPIFRVWGEVATEA